MIYIYSCYIYGTSYQGLTFENVFQEREDRLVYEPAKAFQGSESRGEEAAKLLNKFRINESSSPGVSEELALMALYRTGGDVLKADKQLQSLKQQRVSGADAADIAAHHRLDQAMVCVCVYTHASSKVVSIVALDSRCTIVCTFSKVLSIEALHSKSTRTLTFENFGQERAKTEHEHDLILERRQHNTLAVKLDLAHEKSRTTVNTADAGIERGGERRVGKAGGAFSHGAYLGDTTVDDPAAGMTGGSGGRGGGAGGGGSGAVWRGQKHLQKHLDCDLPVPGNNFSKILYAVTLYGKCTR
jgi:hypothetical protein